MAHLRRFIRMRFWEKLNFLSRALIRLKAVLFYRFVFGSLGRGSSLEKPALLTNPHLIHIGGDVVIRGGVRLEAVPCDSTYIPELRIGDNVRIEHFVQISSAGRVIIGPNVGIASRTMVMCANHPFLDVNDPVRICDRIEGKNTFIEIGEGALIGAGVVILQNVRIGKRSVIGANSVVKTHIPDYCVASGNPAVVVLRYDAEEDRWQRVKH